LDFKLILQRPLGTGQRATLQIKLQPAMKPGRQLRPGKSARSSKRGVSVDTWLQLALSAIHI
jgi:hypothetical protein